MSSNYFPVEILYNILGRLPVKDIVRLRCVCKAWRDLVIDPNFITTHLNLQTDSSRCLLRYNTDQLGFSGKNVFMVFEDRTFAKHSDLEVPFCCETTFSELVGSVNGLLCLSPSSEMFGRTLCLWNPSIWKLKILRQSCFHRKFDELDTFFVIGFGFHYQSNDYKIVRIMYPQHVCQRNVEIKAPKVEVFSLLRNSWRKIRTKAGFDPRDESSTVIVNGCVHWLAFETKSPFGLFILAFDFGSEKFGEITLPNYRHGGDSQSHKYWHLVSVAALRESLVLIVSNKTAGLMIDCCDIWVMREYGMAESWSKQYSIVPNVRCFSCLGIVNDKDLMFNGVDMAGLISYDFDKQEFKPLEFYNISSRLVTFHESLVLHKEGFRLTPRKNLLVEGGIHLGKRKWSVYKLLQQKWL